MAYDPYIRRLFRSALSCISVMCVAGIGLILAAIDHVAWRFTDLSTEVTLALDRLNRSFAQPPSFAAFAAFVQRAKRHERYRSGHFALGHSPT